MTWHVAPSLLKLLAQVDAMAPHRAKDNDGTIGDAAHAARASDHNPNSRGVVCALDITNDPAHGCDASRIAEALRRARDPRIKYVISNKRIFSSTLHPFEWRVYEGLDTHEHHVHISVRDEVSDDYQWTIS